MTFMLDPRLAADTHLIGDFPLTRVLLMDDSRFPWLILVPRIAGARELIDLDAADRGILLDELTQAGRAIEALLAPDKLNIAALGNVVSQLHVHLIARFAHDAAWPRPIWNDGERAPYAAAARDALILKLRDALGPLGL